MIPSFSIQPLSTLLYLELSALFKIRWIFPIVGVEWSICGGCCFCGSGRCCFFPNIAFLQFIRLINNTLFSIVYLYSCIFPASGGCRAPSLLWLGCRFRLHFNRFRRGSSSKKRRWRQLNGRHSSHSTSFVLGRHFAS